MDILSKETHSVLKYQATNSPVVKNNMVLLFNKSNDCIIRVPLTKDLIKTFDLDISLDMTSSETLTNDTETKERQGYETITELLIAEFAKRPPLYDEKLPLSQRTRRIKSALELEVYHALKIMEIAELNIKQTVYHQEYCITKLNIEISGKIPLEDIPKKWKYLKREFRKHKKKLFKYVNSGCSYEEAARMAGKPLWVHFHSMQFIDDDSSTDPYVEEYSSNSHSTSSPLSNCPVQMSPSWSGSEDMWDFPESKPLSNNTSVTTAWDSVKRKSIEQTSASDRMIKQEEIEVEENMDSTDHFCKMLCLELKKLNPQKRAKLEIKYLELLNDVRFKSKD